MVAVNETFRDGAGRVVNPVRSGPSLEDLALPSLDQDFALPDLDGGDTALPGLVDEALALPDLDSDLSGDGGQLTHDDSGEEVVVYRGDSLEDLLAGDEVESEDEEDAEEPDQYSYYEDDEEEDLLQGFDLDSVLADAIDEDASDVHLSPNHPVSFSILGEIHKKDHYAPLNGTMTQRVIQAILTHVLETSFIENLELDTSYVLKSGRHKGRRMRLSVGKTFGEVFMVFRVISDDIPPPDVLGIPQEMVGWTDLSNGLVMMNGPTGTGKSVTLASMLRRIQMERASKIITIERPVEFIYGPEGRSMVTQREVGKDARAFADALTSALRQAPDIIMVGEVRNQDEVNELLRAAETGHLAISTMHTNSAANTITRVKSLYTGSEQARILGSLSEVSRGFANQVLVLSPDGKSRSAVREILTIDEEVSRLILLGDARGIRDYQIERSITMEHGLAEAVVSGKCTAEEARAKTAYPTLLERLLSDVGV